MGQDSASVLPLVNLIMGSDKVRQKLNRHAVKRRLGLSRHSDEACPPVRENTHMG
jgi:hypothetical protein